MAVGAPPQGDGEGIDMNASFVTTSLVGVAVSLPTIATAATSLRFYARRLKNDGKWRADDWTLLITLVACWGHSINTLVAGGIGGIDTISMPSEQYANIALRTLWISSFFLITSLYTVKVSILLFYYHIFNIKQTFRRAVIVMIVILTMWWASSIILAHLSTVPIQAAWTNSARARHRFNFNAWYLTYSGLSIFFDVAILCFPLPIIKSLRVSTKKKISILGIFWLGGFVCVSAIIRFYFLYNSIHRLTDYGKNQYSSITIAFIWAEVEPNTAVVAACLPTYAPLFQEGTLLWRINERFRWSLGLSTRASDSTGVFTSVTTKERSKGYYELDENIGSTSNGDVLSEIDAKKAVVRQEEVHDIEALPRVWLSHSKI